MGKVYEEQLDGSLKPIEGPVFKILGKFLDLKGKGLTLDEIQYVLSFEVVPVA